MNKDIVIEIFKTLASSIDNPVTELNYTNNFTLLVAIILSAQATDKGVNKATEALFKIINIPEDVVALGEEGLKKYIKTIGLFNSKAKHIIAMSELLIAQYNSQVPKNFDDLIKLPGVGRKTANVLQNCAYGMATIAVDTHVQRVSYRIGLSLAKTPHKIEQDLLKIIPTEYLKLAHHLLILHGRYTCTARSPKCQICPIEIYCQKRGLK